MRYEDLNYNDTILPIIFRDDIRRKDQPMYMHWHEAVELLLMQEGCMKITSDTQRDQVQAGQVACIHSGHLDAYECIGESCRYYCLILPPEVLGSEELYQSTLPLVCRKEEIAELFRQIATALERKEDFYREQVRGMIAQLYVALVREGGNQTVGSDRRMTCAVKEALAYMEQHYAQELNVEQIARAVGVSRYHLCHIFKTITGKTLAQYWQSVRCDKARKMLKKGASVAEAAEACGFCSPGYFTKVYQKHFSVLPSEDKI